MEANPLKVGSRIKSIRKNIGLNQTDFAKKINATLPAVSNWETGKNIPNNERLKAISNLGNISVDELLYGTSRETEKDLKEIGQRIFDIRKSKNMTQERFGELFNAKKGVVSRWEKGLNLPNRERIEKIADLGNISVNELLYGTTNEANQVLNALKKLRENISLQLEEAEIELELAKKRDWNPDDEVYATGKKNGLESSLMWIDAAIGFENTETKKLPTAISSRNKHL